MSLSADGPGANHPAALRYSVLHGWKRLLVRLFVRVAGGDTDTSRDYEYTNWGAVAEFAQAFGARLTLKA